jgi:hypothetical protein
MAGIYPLVPGLSLHRGLVELTTGSDATGFTGLVTAIAVALSVGAGVVLGPVLAPALRNEHLHRHRPKVIGSTTTTRRSSQIHDRNCRQHSVADSQKSFPDALAGRSRNHPHRSTTR